MNGRRFLFTDDLPPDPLPQALEPSYGELRPWGGSDVPSDTAGGGTVTSCPDGDSGKPLNLIL